MPRGVLRLHCRVCEKHVDECGPLSARGKCAACGDALLVANHTQLLAHNGPFFDHWLARCRAAFGIAPVDTSSDER